MKSVWEWVLAGLAIILLIIVWNKRLSGVSARALDPKRLNHLSLRP